MNDKHLGTASDRGTLKVLPTLQQSINKLFFFHSFCYIQVAITLPRPISLAISQALSLLVTNPALSSLSMSFQWSRPHSPHPRANTGVPGEQSAFSFNSVPLEQYVGNLYALCKDRRGCLYLERKLMEENPVQLEMIFNEICPHVVELMGNIFGNYLYQKLLVCANDAQRTILICRAAPRLVHLAIDQHGTRAVQTVAKFVATNDQTKTAVISAIHDHVIQLIKHIHGYHVIRILVASLASADAQFIYDVIGSRCVEVSNHHHGCDVMRSCVYYATGDQKIKLIQQLTANAFLIVMDPYGSFVIQEILDHNEPYFTRQIYHRFKGRIAILAKQRISSNVVEKCIRTSDSSTSRGLIEEFLSPAELRPMLTHPFANYVIQTAIDFSDGDTCARLIDAIRPLLPSIRQHPYSRGIARKVESLDSGRGLNNRNWLDPRNINRQLLDRLGLVQGVSNDLQSTISNNSLAPESLRRSFSNSTVIYPFDQNFPSDWKNVRAATTDRLHIFPPILRGVPSMNTMLPFLARDRERMRRENSRGAHETFWEA